MDAVSGAGGDELASEPASRGRPSSNKVLSPYSMYTGNVMAAVLGYPAMLKPSFFTSVLLVAMATSASAGDLRVEGAAGFLSEWRLSGKIEETAVNARRQLSGSLTMEHVGLCTHDGPNEKVASIKIDAIGPRPAWRIQGALAFDGAECKFSGILTDNYSGFMTCPNAPGIPLSFSAK